MTTWEKIGLMLTLEGLGFLIITTRGEDSVSQAICFIIASVGVLIFLFAGNEKD